MVNSHFYQIKQKTVKRPTLDPSSGLNLKVVSPSPMLGSMLGVEPTLKKFVLNLKMIFDCFCKKHVFF